MRNIARVALAATIGGFMTASAWAQQPAAGPSATTAPAAPSGGAAASASGGAAEASTPAKRFTVTTGLDFTSAYLFRGIRQHSGGTIAQPYADLGMALGSGVSANIGGWDSVHSTAPAGNWYESDYYASVTFTAGKLKPGLLYTSYTSPADSFATVKELAGVLTVDDSANPFPLSPKIVLAFELGDGQADGGANKGTYLELGVRPGVKLAPKATLYIPVKTGLSVNNYYEGPTGDNHFGFFDTGLQLSVPVISGKGGSLETHGGVDFMWLGDNLKAFNGGDGFKPVYLVGLTFTY